MKGFFIFFIIFIPVFVHAQIVGTVYNENREVLPFASVYLENSTKGTIANSEGEFELGLEPGDYKLVFQYTGYIKHFESIHYKGGKVELTIILKESKFNLGEIVFSAKREDPA
ncbi:MAG TPA: carboxypeptidase-like regulatory domain-containing protein, partial [Saprospiraceae bacterium]|nr:carboxypeptidase-like regulatory domain-containing protein [Saprospiraceae bacterium]